MQNADALLAIIRDRGSRGLPLERVYRLLFNRDLYLRAYARLYANKGAMTRGATLETVDGMSLAKIDAIIDALRYERYHWTPVRRVAIPKSNGKQRLLGIPSWSDKLLQEVLRSILEAYFEPQFVDQSHGFRPNRGCHTALQEIEHTWKGTKWFIEGDIAQYFDTINHDRLLTKLGEHIHDGRFLRLIRELLTAGYVQDWKYNKTLSGAPQGGVLSPLLSNIYLHMFDQWVTTELLPAYTRGERRKTNAAYHRINCRLYWMRKRGQTEGVRQLLHQRRTLPQGELFDPDYRRLRYIRYADDFLLGFAGPKQEAEAIKQRIKAWLGDTLHLTLSEEKTLITHAASQHASFLGYHISARYIPDRLDKHKHRVVTGNISLRVPAKVIEERCARYLRNGVIMHRPEMIEDSDYTIVTLYQQHYRGIVQYYLPARNVGWFAKLRYVMETSLLKTLAYKHKTTVTALAAKLKRRIQTPEGKSLTCLEVRVERDGKAPLIARFGGISLARQPLAVLDDQPFVDKGGRSDLLKRLLAQECELCGSRECVEVHHIRKLADLTTKGRREKPAWAKRMIERHRKTLVVCQECHRAIHAGRPTRPVPTGTTGEPGAAKVASPVRGGADGKGQ